MANTDLTIKTGLLYEKQLDDNGNIINRIPMAPKTLSNCVICTQKDDNGNNMTLNDFISKVIAGDYSGDIDLSGYVSKTGNSTITGDLTVNELRTGSLYIDRQEIDGSGGLTFQVNDNNNFNFNGGDIILDRYHKYSGNGSDLTNINAANIEGILPVSKGGTGNSTFTTNAVLLGNGTSVIKTKASVNGAFYSTGNNTEPNFGTLPIAQGGTGNTSFTNGKIIRYNTSSGKLESNLSVDVYNETSGMANSTSDSYIPTSKAVKGYINSEIRTRRVSVDILSGYTNDYKNRTGNVNYDLLTQRYAAIGVEGSLVPAPAKGNASGIITSDFDHYKLYSNFSYNDGDNNELYNPSNHFIEASLGWTSNRWHFIFGKHVHVHSLSFNSDDLHGVSSYYGGLGYTWNTSYISHMINLEIETLQDISQANWDNRRNYYGYGKNGSVANNPIIYLIARSGVRNKDTYKDNERDDTTYNLFDTSYIRLGGPFIDINTDNFNLTGKGIHTTEDDYHYTMHVCKIYNTIIVSGEVELSSDNSQTIDIPFPDSILSLLKYHPHIDNNTTDAYKFTCSFEKYSYGLNASITGYNNSAYSKVPVIHVIGITVTNTMYFTFITNG